MIVFSGEQEEFRRNVRRFVEKEITPHVEEWENARMHPRELYRKLGELGYLGIIYPEEYGGTGGTGEDFKTMMIFMEELCRCQALAIPLSIIGHPYMLTPYVYHLGNEEQRQKFAVPAIKGEKLFCLALSEPNCGSDIASVETTAKKEGDYYRVNGSKMFISNATQADTVILLCRTGKGKGYNGLSLLLVDTETPGFSVGKKLTKLGCRSSDTAEIVFEDCMVSKENLLGAENEGFMGVMKELQYERFTMGGLAVGGAMMALKRAIKYAKERIQFGKPLTGSQVIRHKLVDMATELEVTRVFAYHIAGMLDNGIECFKEVSMLKRYSAETCARVISEALQIHGGYGYIDEFPIERLYRDIRLWSIFGGTSEIQKEIIATRLGLD